MTSNIETDSGAVTNVCGSGPLSDTIITAVADAKGVDPLDLEPLHYSVDPDALDTLFEPTIGRSPTSLELTFSYDDCEVVVHADGEVTVTPPSSEQGERPTAAPANDE